MSHAHHGGTSADEGANDMHTQTRCELDAYSAARDDEDHQRFEGFVDDVLRAREHWVASNPSFQHQGRVHIGAPHVCRGATCALDCLCVQIFRHAADASNTLEVAHRCYSVFTAEQHTVDRCEAPWLHKPAGGGADAMATGAAPASGGLALLFSHDAIYVCRQTGHLHWCGSMCDQSERIDVRSGVATCSVTGRADERRVELAYKMQHNDVVLREKQQLFRDTFYNGKARTLGSVTEWARELVHCKTFAEIREFMARTRSSTRARDTKRCYLMTAVGQIWLLLCDESSDAFRHAQQKQQEQALSFVTKTFDSHRRRTLQARHRDEPPPLCVLSEIDDMYRKLQRSYCFTEGEQSTDVIGFMVQHARITMMVWQKLHEHARTADIACTFNSFRAFVTPTLYMLRDGLTAQSYGTAMCNVSVFTRHEALAAVLPTVEQLQRTAQCSQLVDWSLRQRIEHQIKQAVYPGGVNPCCFDIHQMDYSSLRAAAFPLPNARPAASSRAVVTRVAAQPVAQMRVAY
jgi:hypothetical protein